VRKETKYFVEYLSPGLIVAEDWRKEIDSLEPHTIKWPANAYCFRLFEREDVIDEDKIYEGKERQVGPTYYHPKSKIETLAEVEKNPQASSTLISNMRCNKRDKIVWSRWGNWPQPFNPKEDCVLSR